MKVGDLVRGWQHKDANPDAEQVGIIVEVIDHVEVPPVCKVLWQDGDIVKEWTDDLEVIDD